MNLTALVRSLFMSDQERFEQLSHYKKKEIQLWHQLKIE